MCGIAGYVGSSSAAPILLDSLQKLEYRGYDSCGLAVFDGRSAFVARALGRTGDLSLKIPASISGGFMGMAHTRWATHGRPSEKNAHPLHSCDGEILAVHNGIIENADELRAQLVGKGHRFLSDTDSEVIPHLLEVEVRQGKSLEAAVLSLKSTLRGTFAIIVGQKGTQRLLMTRHGSPLVVGIGDGEYFPASDIPSFLERTAKVLFLREDDCVSVSREGIHLFRSDVSGAVLNEAAPEPSMVTLDPSSASKGNFAHYMIKEIMEQTSILERIIYRSPDVLAPPIALLRSAGRIYVVGAGTSYHAGLFAQYLFAQLAHRDVSLHFSSEFANVAPVVDPEDVVIVLSQSGETADTLAAAQLAKERGAKLIALTNVELSSLSRLADLCVPLHSGIEIAVASTKTYTAQLSLLYQLIAGLGGTATTCSAELWRARDALFGLTSDAAREHSRRVGQVFVDARDVYLIGRGVHRVTALEAALKLKEVAGLRAEAFPGGEMKHGPLALVEDGTPVVVFYGQADLASAESSASELDARGARIYSVGPSPLRVSTEHIRVDDTGFATPIPQMLPMQILAYETARLRNRDPDHPRNLAKAVTVL
ncbi:MAG: glutamine--fructose-6-phosphate transaminase (isomerizing) [Thermoplasmata archaeon]